MQRDSESRLRQDFESPRGLRIRGAFGATVASIVAGLLLILLLDPLGWLAGPPAIHEAKKYVALSLGAIMLPCIGGIWFLVVAPLRWGAIIGGNPKSAKEYLVFRSEDPRRFWSIWRVNVLILLAGFGTAIWCSTASIRHLRDVQ